MLPASKLIVDSPHSEAPSLRSLILLLAVALALRLAPALAVIHYNPDSIEYLDIGRHFARGEGLTSCLQIYYLGRDEVWHYGPLVRPPLLSVWIGMVLWLFGSLRVVQVSIVLLSVLNLWLLYTLFARLAGARVAFYGTLVLSLWDLFYRTSYQAGTEQPALLFVLLALLLLTAPLGVLQAGLAGTVLGLAFLTHSSNLPLVALALAYVLWQNRLRGFKAAAALAICWALVVAPLFLSNRAWGLPTFMLPAQFLYGVSSYTAALGNTGLRVMSGGEFVLANPHFVAERIASNVAAYARGFWRNLGPFAPFAPLALLGAVSNFRRAPQLLLMWSFLAAKMLVPIFTWAGRDGRYAVAPVGLLLPLCLAEADRWLGGAVLYQGVKRRLTVMGVLVMLAAAINLPYFLAEGYRAVQPRFQGRGVYSFDDSNYRDFYLWAQRQSPESVIIGSDFPWVISLTTHLPCVYLPPMGSRGQMEDYLRRFAVTHLAVYEGFQAAESVRAHFSAPQKLGPFLLYSIGRPANQ